MEYKSISEQLPPEYEEVIFWNKDWVDEFNPKGVRIGFMSDDETFYTAQWRDYQDSYFSRDSMHDNDSFSDKEASKQKPTHWAAIAHPIHIGSEILTV